MRFSIPFHFCNVTSSGTSHAANKTIHDQIIHEIHSWNKWMGTIFSRSPNWFVFSTHKRHNMCRTAGPVSDPPSVASPSLSILPPLKREKEVCRTKAVIVVWMAMSLKTFSVCGCFWIQRKTIIEFVHSAGPTLLSLVVFTHLISVGGGMMRATRRCKNQLSDAKIKIKYTINQQFRIVLSSVVARESLCRRCGTAKSRNLSES